jgi:hypothetical protein
MQMEHDELAMKHQEREEREAATALAKEETEHQRTTKAQGFNMMGSFVLTPHCGNQTRITRTGCNLTFTFSPRSSYLAFKSTSTGLLSWAATIVLCGLSHENKRGSSPVQRSKFHAP